MAPLLISKGDRPVLALGGAGGARILNCLAQVAINVLDHEMTVQDAIDAPRIDCSETTILVDSRYPHQMVDELTGLGHTVRLLDEAFGVNHFARACAIGMGPDGLEAGADRFAMWAVRTP
jgi:gamma-glutamyltranspeptidase/glutathione hydrolase